MPQQSFKVHAKRTLGLSLPLIISQLTVVAMSVVDTVMAGNLGPVTLAAVAVGSSVWATAILFVLGLLMAIPPVVAEMDGADKHGKIAPFFRQAMWVALFLGLIFTLVLHSLPPIFSLFKTRAEVIPEAIGYLHGIGWGVLPLCFFIAFRYLADGMSITKPTMLVSFLGLMCNIPLNWILMYGKFGLPAMGAAGCGYASAMVLVVQMLAYAAVIKHHRVIKTLHIFQRFDAPQWREMWRFVRLGFPIGVSMFAEVGFFSIVTLLASSLSTAAVAAHQIALNFSSLLFMIPLGLSMGISIRVGNAVGRGNPQEIRRCGLFGIALVLATQLLSVSIIIFLGRFIVLLYSSDLAVVEVAVGLLVFAAWFQLSDGIQVAAAGALRGIKDMNFIMLSNVFSFWGLGFVCSWYLCFVQQMGIRGLWIGLIVGLTSAAVLNLSRYHLKTKV